MKILFLVLAGGDSSHNKDIVTSRNTWLNNLPPSCSYLELYASSGETSYSFENHRVVVDCLPTYENILLKTVLTLRLIKEEIPKYDLVIRTNVSSYFVISKLEKFFLKVDLSKNFYGGYIEQIRSANSEIIPFVSGAGIFLSPKSAQILSELDSEEYSNMPDDVAFSTFFQSKGITPFFIPRGNICYHRFFSIANHYRLKSSTQTQLASLRMIKLHEFYISSSKYSKVISVLKLSLTELRYFQFTLSFFKNYAKNVYQAAKIFVKYRHTNMD